MLLQILCFSWLMSSFFLYVFSKSRAIAHASRHLNLCFCFLSLFSLSDLYVLCDKLSVRASACWKVHIQQTHTSSGFMESRPACSGPAAKCPSMLKFHVRLLSAAINYKMHIVRPLYLLKIAAPGLRAYEKLANITYSGKSTPEKTQNRFSSRPSEYSEVSGRAGPSPQTFSLPT
ncbi:uncharacterized protein NEMAJ01_0974 [Nematocida major]|uniref:uncharacterized protein n=1 Tax=Nematocida major TaxID=1912982 RepID=UPI0020073CE1|nr:uncharacterized protein NEMAJ01_0974 [Nematocida major]KAH9386078.1 hypothetical protein NEMAJ01_0974 [Nematocida major]